LLRLWTLTFTAAFYFSNRDFKMTTTLHRLSGMQKFTLIGFAQMLSMFGTATTRFALLIWAYQQTHQATPLALLGFFSFSLYVLLSPIGGVVADRFDRRLVIIAGDMGAGLMTALMLALYTSGHLQIWHLYIAEALTGAFEAFQLPAYNAAVTMLIPKEHYGRASGMRSLSQSASQVFAPVFAALILPVIGISGVMVIDLISFAIGTLPLLFITIPRPVPQSATTVEHHHFWRDISTGFHYILARKGLLGLLLIYAGINFAASLTYFAVLAPLVLARTGGDQIALGNVQAAMGVGGVIGGILMSVWGGPKKRIHGVLAVCGVSFLLGDFLMAVGRSTPAWMFAILVSTLFVPIIVGSNRAIWQSKVAPAIQGRVFSVEDLCSTLPLPIGYLLAGPLADRLFEPAMAQGGSLSGVFGWLVGTGPGAGMGLMFLCTCIMGTTICFSGYLFRSIRNVESELPDHDGHDLTKPETKLTEVTASLEHA
jgi:MFS family permease